MMKKGNKFQGLGSDLVEIERIRQSIDRHGQHFLNRICTQKEQDYCYKFKDPMPHFAGRFAAKEAVAKALGTGIGALLSWHDMEIVSDEQGKPFVVFSPAAKKTFHDPVVLITISHTHDHALAVALWGIKPPFKNKTEGDSSIQRYLLGRGKIWPRLFVGTQNAMIPKPPCETRNRRPNR